MKTNRSDRQIEDSKVVNNHPEALSYQVSTEDLIYFRGHGLSKYISSLFQGSNKSITWMQRLSNANVSCCYCS